MIRILLPILALLLGACSGDLDPQLRKRTQPWPEEVLATVSAVPVQDGGRVKPLSTYAMFTLLGTNGNREFSLKWADGQSETLSPTAWLLDCVFFPEQARHYRCLRIDNDEAVVALGLHLEGRKRLDRYSYEELRPAHDRLMELGSNYQRIEAKNRTAVQQQIFTLANQVWGLDRLFAWLDFARLRVDIHRTEGLKAAFPEPGARPMSWALQNLPVLFSMRQVVQSGNGDMSPERREQEARALGGILDEVERALRGSEHLSFLAPPDRGVAEWWGVFDLARAQSSQEPIGPRHLEALQHLEVMAAGRNEPAVFATAAQGLLAATRAAAAERGEYGKIETEVSFYRADWFYRALLVFGLGFVLAALSWSGARGRWLARGAFGAVGLGTVLLVVGIVFRCIIRGRPPVSTLYETILFIAAIAAIVALIIEWIDRRRVGLTLGAFFGMGGMFLARKFEELEGTDTMPQLVAVLDTNFWLSTHVTTVTMGYCAGLLASVIGTLYIAGKLTRLADAQTLTRLARMVYGVTCFGLFFSLVGTILGGVWANYSWGRFWGWDPKENGALLICLAQIAILHGRMAGWLKQHGLAMASVGCGIVVAFSWWHVNLLGVGLHSYGFTAGVLKSLTGFYMFQLAVLIAGTVAWYRAPAPASSSASDAVSGAEAST